MMLKEDIQKLIADNTDLSFVDLFLRDHPTANLFFVGGALRDILLHRRPQDFDFVIQHLSAERIESWFSKHGKIERVGKNFEVFTFMGIDLALPRTEHARSDSLGGYREFDVQSNPDLPIEEDLARRDFTINAMAYDMRDEKLIDPFDGQKDLAHTCIRAVGDPDQRFREDLTRMLRAIRFAAQLHFTIESNTFEAIKTIAPELNRIKKTDGKNSYVVAREMIGEELAKAFSSQPFFTANTLQESGLLEELFPGVARSFHVDAHYFTPLSNVEAYGIDLAMILFLRGLTGEETRTAIQFTGLDTLPKSSPYRLHTERVVWVVSKLHESPFPKDVACMRASQFEKQFMSEHGQHHVQALIYLKNNAVVHAVQKRRDEICARWKCEDHEPIPPLVRGDDLLRLGIPAGIRIRELLEHVRDLQLDGKLLTREAALAWIRTKKN